MSLNYLLLLLVAVFGVSGFLTRVVRTAALKKSIMDLPTHRSSHKLPTPRGGGLGFVLIFLAFLMVCSFTSILYWQYAAFFIAAIMIASIGFIDDLNHVSAKIRLLIHFVSGIVVVLGLGGVPSISFYVWVLPEGLFVNFFAILFLVWMINLYNFMDGIDGLAAIEAISVGLGIAFLHALSGNYNYIIPPLLLAAAVSGFLYWNFPPARIFMGDSGSGFLGLVLGVFTLQATVVNSQFFWAFCILLGVFIVDATGTLLVRLIKGAKLSEAHCTHAYQQAAKRYGHLPVSLSVLLLNTLWLFPMAYLAAKGYCDGLVAIIIAYMPLLWLLYKFKSGQKKHTVVENIA